MNRYARSALLFAASMLLAGVASATTLANANDSDMAAQFLDVLLGAATDSTTTSVSALSAGMRMLNIFALTGGTVMFVYMVVIGTLKSAEDGQLLGKQWSSMWIPLRFTFGCAMLVPLGSGYSTAQMGMITLAKAGSTAASAVWRESAGYLAGGGDRNASQLNSARYAEALDVSIRNILKAESCVVVKNDYYAFLGAKFGLLPMTQAADGSYLAEWGYAGAADAQPFTRRECGKLMTAAYAPVGERSLSLFDDNGMPQSLKATYKGDIQATKDVITAQALGIRLAALALRPAAKKIAGLCGAAGQQACLTATERSKEIEDAVKLAAQAYTMAVQPALKALYASAIGGDKLIKASTESGWVMAGTSMFTMARVQTEITKLEGWTPNVLPPTEDEVSSQSAIGSDDAASLAWAANMGSRAKNDVANTVGRSLAQKISYLLGGDPTDKRHILVQIKEGGDFIMTSMQSILALVGLAGIFGGGKVLTAIQAGAAVIPGASLIAAAGEAIGIAALVLFMAGVVMSLVLPLMPFVLWAGSVLGWLVAVVQAVIAAPVWIAAHLHPDGDDLTGKGQNGYLILLEVALRPAFMVLGLVSALALVDIMGRWVGYAFFATVDSVQSESWTGVVSIVTTVIIYVGLTFTIIRTCFGLVHDVPSTIMTWIGGSHAGHDKGAEFGQAAQGQINNGMARAEAPLMGAGVRALGGSKKDAHAAGQMVDGGRPQPQDAAPPNGEIRNKETG